MTNACIDGDSKLPRETRAIILQCMLGDVSEILQFSIFFLLPFFISSAHFSAGNSSNQWNASHIKC